MRRDHDIDARLVELRRDAPKPKAKSTSRRWPPKVRDRFRKVHGVPEVAGDRLGPRDVRSGILRHGCLLVRGLITEARVARLVDDIDRAFAAYDAYARGTPEVETAPWFVPFEPGADTSIQREWTRDGGGILAVDSPPALFDIIEAFEDVGIRELVRAYLGDTPMLLASKWTLRRIRPSEHEFEPETGLDFHQDGAFMGTDIRSVNVWLSLSHCGEDAPGLDIVPRRLDRIVETGTDGAGMHWTVGPPLARRVGDGAIATPVFEPGDALMFDHLLLHRTGLAPHMTTDRYAIEAWFAAPSEYADAQIPIAY